VRRGGRLPGDQAEIVFSDILIEQLNELGESERIDVLAEIVRLCGKPAGKHPLHAPLSGWNTLDVLHGAHRVVYKASVTSGTGLIEVLCLGPRRDSEIYDMAIGIGNSGLLTDDELTQLWEVLGLLDVAVESVGLEGWDYRPAPAPEGLRRAAVAAGLLDEKTASLLAKDEVEAAMADGWGVAGPDPTRALRAALRRARGSGDFDERKILEARLVDRCGAIMPRAKATCVRRAGHPGPHRRA
jgi:hypothetical protein